MGRGLAVGLGLGVAVGVGVGTDCAQYLPPVLRTVPPQTIISLPVQTAVCKSRPSGALVVLVAVQLSALGLNLPPVFKEPSPPQTIISLPVQTALWEFRAEGALIVLVAVQLSALGLYLPPVL